MRDLLLKVKPYVDTVNEVYVNDFQAGKIDLGITYSGDGLRIQAARKKEGDIAVIAPEGKSEIWTDNWAISAYAPDPVAAHAWINFILQPEVNAKEMEYVAYEVGTPASYPLVGDLAQNPLVVFPDRILNDYEILETTPERAEQPPGDLGRLQGGVAWCAAGWLRAVVLAALGAAPAAHAQVTIVLDPGHNRYPNLRQRADRAGLLDVSRSRTAAAPTASSPGSPRRRWCCGSRFGCGRCFAPTACT